MKLNDFDYTLPEKCIAQTPADPRDSARLMLLDRADKAIVHRTFRDILDLVEPGDVLVLNSTRVIPARLLATRTDTGGKLEVLLLRQLDELHWRVLIGGKRADVGMPITFEGGAPEAVVTQKLEGAERVIAFERAVNDHLNQAGEMPLPPYIQTRLEDAERYQTVYSKEMGSAAAPTAGLHFTPELLLALREKGVRFAYCTLHIGLDTFQPVRVEDIEKHKIHSERAELTNDNARIINEAKLAGKRIIAVGTTTARTLETAGILSAGGVSSKAQEISETCAWRPVIAFDRDTDLFIYPGYTWRVVDALITNFHLPKSTLLMMIASFAGRDFVLDAYHQAIESGYRFFSFGDAMFIR